MTLLRLMLAAVFGSCLAPSAMAAECLPAPPGAELTPVAGEASGATGADRAGRVIAPVMVNGQGPFRFIIDTGANRSVISQSLATRMGLTPVGTGQVHSIDGVTAAPLVNVESIEFGGVPVDGAAMPVLEGGVLGGADGLLGVDGLQGRRLTMDFRHSCIEIAPSQSVRHFGGWSTIEGQLHFGHLVLVDGRVRGRRVNILVDTGASATMANSAMRDLLREFAVRTEVVGEERVRAYTAGAPIVLDTAMLIPRLSFGDITARNVLAYVGDFHIFDVWGLSQEPTLLIGMDALSQARGISIDYETGTVRLRFEDQVRTGSRIPRSANSDAGITVAP